MSSGPLPICAAVHDTEPCWPLHAILRHGNPPACSACSILADFIKAVECEQIAHQYVLRCRYDPTRHPSQVPLLRQIAQMCQHGGFHSAADDAAAHQEGIDIQAVFYN